ncbi:MAG: DUF4290 domain-containing protein [Bacteroidetes bacterium]|nr:DUF4290 domain-containing protein [Bacteroidota bacterium]
MEYNTTRPKILISEYGRKVQEMIQYACTIEDREKRNKVAKFIVSVMAQMHQQQRDTADFRRKLWDHLIIISDFKLDVDNPFPPPQPLTLSTKPTRLDYHDKEIEYRHYGKNISVIIEKAITFDEGPEKEALVSAIANHLKKAFLTWNRESVTDETIEEHLKILSKGRLQLSDDFKLNDTNDILARHKRKKFNERQPESNGNPYKPKKKRRMNNQQNQQ